MPTLVADKTQPKDDALTRGLQDINQTFKEREAKERAKALGLQYVDLRTIGINPDVFAALPEEISKAAQIVPFYLMGNKLRVATPNSEATKAKQTIDFLAKRYQVEVAICTEESLHFAQKGYAQKFYVKHEQVIAKTDESHNFNLGEELTKAKQLPEKMASLKSDLALNELHKVALHFGTSDIHLQPQKNGSLVRGRIDGALREIMMMSEQLAVNIIRQIKHDAHLKYNVTNLPQDGKYQFYADERQVDVRVSTFPTVFGESVVLRFLDPKKGIVPLHKLGFTANTQNKLEEAIAGTTGMILVTGPTGSGKTTTLYSSIDKINDNDKKIITLEDPVEFQLPGILQSGIDEKVGYTFAAGLKAILRQDPDVVLVGEIRDQATAETAVQAALTGHIVFSTLHTNSAADAIPRLLNMGVKPFVLAPALRMVAAQRLVRTLCPHCSSSHKSPLTNDDRELLLPTVHHLQSIGHEIDLPAELYTPEGCELCGQSGYKGVIAVIELINVDESINQLVFENAAAAEIKNTAIQNGMLTMWQDGILKVLDGKTTLEELKRKVEQ